MFFNISSGTTRDIAQILRTFQTFFSGSAKKICTLVIMILHLNTFGRAWVLRRQANDRGSRYSICHNNVPDASLPSFETERPYDNRYKQIFIEKSTYAEIIFQKQALLPSPHDCSCCGQPFGGDRHLHISKHRPRDKHPTQFCL